MLKKKEKLEQMRELGRGGLSKGLHFLRTAAVNASLENGDASTSSGTGDDGNEGMTNRMTYEELLALSMKLTRQNKLMKVQYQKNQSKLAAAATSDAEIQALRGFLEQEVGLDVTSCLRASDPENKPPGGSIDLDELKEKYRILTKLKQKDVPQETKSPAMVPTALDSSACTYEEIDLSETTEKATVPSKEVDEAMKQVEKMTEALKRGALETKELETKWMEKIKELEAAKQAVEDDKKRVEQQWAQKWEEQRQLVEELKHQMNKQVEKKEEKEEEEENDEAMKHELEKQLRDLSERLDGQIKERQAEQQQAAASLALVEQEKAALMQRLVQAEAACSIDNDKVEKRIETAQAALQRELEVAKADNARLQTMVQTLEETNAEEEEEEKDSMAWKALEAELEALQKDKVRLEQTIHELQQAAATVVETPLETEETTSLRAEVERLRGLIAASEGEKEALQQEVASLKTNTGQMTVELATDAALMHEMERVKLASAEQVHEMETLQQKLQVAEENVAKTKHEDEATQALVQALKRDASRLADEVAGLEQKLEAEKKERIALSEAKQALQEQQEQTEAAKATLAQQLEEERVYWTSKLESLITESDAARTKSEMLEKELQEKETHVTQMTASQRSMTAEVSELQQQVKSMREDLVMAGKSLEAQATKTETYERRCLASEHEVTKVKHEMDKLRAKHREKLQKVEQEKAKAVKRLETELQALTKEKTTCLHELDELQTRYQTLERELETAHTLHDELETSLSTKTFEVGNLSADLAETKKTLSDRMALATRLQTENMSMAGQIAEQVALLEGTLRDAAKARAAEDEMKKQVQLAHADVEQMKQKEQQANKALAVAQQALHQEQEKVKTEREQAQKAVETAVTKAQQEFQRERARLEAESKHKSKLALQAVLEKEKEIARLSARLEQVEEDVRSGGAENRQILALAQLQATRDAEARHQATQLDALRAQLLEAQREIHELRDDKRRHAHELTALLQNQRRDGVNMEYLKNVVVQYMSFPPGSSQQARLVPVLSTLLQFTAADVKEIQHAGRRATQSWTSWGNSDVELAYKPIVVDARPRPEVKADHQAAFETNETKSISSSYYVSNGSSANPFAESADF